ncbi:MULTISPECIES: hypothetical protein [Olivibacter]|uniref:Outer membrane protein beta-barrel domain-containing protein n=1 Tax=Olivibacter jilunii TaxID=985016 RepID=A0ABW6B9V4_9SPHI|nr:hypothetical protein [Olivibacter sp. 47]MCL4641542.1 hypothetical protein [Olivibacter sp. UJ_SKK_5.1]MDM8177113.1 hypothetical protein [Olivibacter sp. 47]MDX3912561.1 hypothetical protein [Pseudosphingobacterium sp.]
MKRVFLFSALVLGSFLGLKAQNVDVNKPQMSESVGMVPIQKGNWMVGGSLGSMGYSFEGESFNVNINPRAGYFVSDGIAIGLALNGGYGSVKDDEDNWTYGIAPFVRYFFPEGSSATGRFFGQGEVGIAGANKGSDVTFAAGVGLGYAHFITRSVALEAVVGYNYSKANNASAQAQNGLGFNLGFQIYLPGQGNR